MRCDLHLHSNHSDGRLPPEEVVKEARRASLDCIALTDHDTLAGVPEAIAEAGRLTGGPRLIWACEVTTSLAGRELHVLAYFGEKPDAHFDEFLVEARAARQHRIVTGLQELERSQGIEVSLGELGEFSGGQVLSRAHVAQALVHRKIAPDTKRAFERHLGDAMGVFPSTTLSPTLACEAIHASGGLAIWAHPRSDAFTETLAALRAAGIDGIESTTRTGGHDEQKEAAALAFDLMVSGGSDWHGYGRPPSNGHWSVPGARIQRLLGRLGITV